MGTTSFNSSLPGQLGQSGASVGIGARVAVGKHFNLRVDFAQVVDAAGNQAKNDQMLNAAIAVPF
jgi:hemolysin activation/secretion protein